MASYLDCSKRMLFKNQRPIIIFIALFCCGMQSVFAQRIDDTSIYDKVEQITEDTVSISTKTYENDDIKIVSLDNDDEDIKVDTLLHKNNFFIKRDSILAWRNNKKYSWITDIDTLLKAEQTRLDSLNKPQKAKPSNIKLPSSNFSLNSSILSTFFILIAACFVAFILYNLFLSKGIFKKQTQKLNVQTEDEIDENDLDNDFYNLFEKAIAAGSNRMGIRYIFLHTLKTLNEKGFIHFAADKTNSQYTRELNSEKKNGFTKLALYYEYIWYGNIAISKQQLEEIIENFKIFLQNV